MKKKNKVIVICGVSGAGKTFLISSALNRFTNLKKLTAITTRPKRQRETSADGKRFVDDIEFENLYNQGRLFIVNTVFGYKYAFDTQEYGSLIQHSHIILELKLSDLHQMKEICEAMFVIYVYPQTPELAVQYISDRNTADLRLKDLRQELLALKNKDMPNSDLINTMFCNDFDSSSVNAFISIVENVIL